MNFSNYIVYVDESGDHSLTSINKDFPIFVLAFCIFDKEKYSQSAVLKLKDFKFKHFGHDMVVLHENEIRRDKGWFKILNSKEKKEAFIDELTQIIYEEDFTIIATVIQKDKLFSHTNSPYDIALKYCMERTYRFLESKNEHTKMTHIIVEQRGKNEDEELELEFRRVCDGYNFKNIRFPFEIILANKMSNSAGLQLADLVARPIGLSVLKPEQTNRAFEVLKDKFHKSDSGRVEGVGLKVYP
ncbi:MAG: DUF3800 domain-containing protein [Sulfuricurvum sp.]|uniref:DUF3800 domain-containing protein n=1 Tax=Sulfuricurvum sp. TaxID=2025608 RepID=UPI002610F1D0|nr:DUF3800 domain-containing protein [Sulfuricurvum sp.]MDD2830498.1 DUF3800 domain-containing protein [Sulfuricurvum sp.]MDD4949485.1 DUF3800 domain-containing protein [Sulfuricurvum sp.]